MLIEGLICSINAAELSELDDFFSFISNNNNKASTTSPELKSKKNTKTTNGHKLFEMSFPLFNDIFPITGFGGKSKDSIKLYQDDKDPISDGGEQRSFSKIFKSKKKPKDKIIMSFTEFFVPFSNRKSNPDFSGMPKKFDFFEEFFKDFPFKDFEEPILKHRVQRRVLNTTNSSKGGNIFENLFMINNSRNGTEPKMNMLVHRPQRAADIYDFNSALETDTGAEKQIEGSSCCGHPECKMHGHCQLGMCADKLQEDNSNTNREKDISKIIETINMDKLIRIALLYTVPIMIGIGGIIIAIEVVRKHKNIVKNTKMLRDYDKLQHC